MQSADRRTGAEEDNERAERTRSRGLRSGSNRHSSTNATDKTAQLQQPPSDLYSVLTYPCKATDLHEYYFGSLTRAIRRDKGAEDLVERWGGALSELSFGFYDEQIARLLQLFPPHQVLVLFQEDMWDDTLHTLRKVETFLGLPCFNFSSIALPSSKPGYPPQRAPVGFREKVKAWTLSMLWPFSKVSSSKTLQSSLMARTKSLLDELYAPHSRRLLEVLEGMQIKESSKEEGKEEDRRGEVVLPSSWVVSH